MDTAFTTNPPTDDEAETEAAIARILEQIREVREEMRADDEAISRLKVESQALKLETAVLRAEAGAMKLETTALREETRALLAGLRFPA